MTLSSNNSSGRTMKFPIDASSVQKSARRTTRTARRMKGFLALAALSLALVALPSQAFATQECSNANNNSTDGQYCNQVQSLQAGLGSGGGGGGPAERVAVPAASTGPSLPFTGLDVAALAVVALALTGTGVVLRRLATIGDSEK
jgi:hypothetical protein